VDPAGSPRRTRHALFGEIPLIRCTSIDSAGRVHAFYEYDPDYTPRMPTGAVRGDIRQQECCHFCHVPRYFYVDERKLCVQCGEPFVFSAKEQKYWYETLKFNFNSVAVRCAACRRKRRNAHVLEQRLSSARSELKTRPDSPALLLCLAEAIARLFQRRGEGNLNDAIAAARKARREARTRHHRAEAAEALFWEATCQALAGRDERARPLYEEYLSIRYHGRNHSALGREARDWLDGKAMGTETHDVGARGRRQ
jgi:hypothetical protein